MFQFQDLPFNFRVPISIMGSLKEDLPQRDLARKPEP